MNSFPRIFLVHAARSSIAPAEAAFLRDWPAVQPIHFLDESLSRDVARVGGMSDSLVERFSSIADYCVLSGANGILFTCSAFAEAIVPLKSRFLVPIMTPNEAQFEALIEINKRAVVLVNFAPSVQSLSAEFWATDGAASRRGRVEFRLLSTSPDAKDATAEIATYVATNATGIDVIALGQFSMAPVMDALTAASKKLVLDTPSLAVQKMRRLITASQRSLRDETGRT